MDERINSELEIQKTDIAVSAMKSALGVLPIIGPLMSELVGYTIPNQRFDRLIKFFDQLERKVNKLDNSVLKLALQDENFTDLVEESLRQAVRSLSDERREYIAYIIANSLTQERMDFVESKHILKILGELNDIEVILLRYHLCRTINSDIEFRRKHENIIQYQRRPNYNAPQNILDKYTLHKSYNEHLVELGLLNREYESVKVDSDGKVPISNRVRGYYLTSLGHIILRQINLYDENL